MRPANRLQSLESSAKKRAGLEGSPAAFTIMKVGLLHPPAGAPLSDLHHGALWTSQALRALDELTCAVVVRH